MGILYLRRGESYHPMIGEELPGIGVEGRGDVGCRFRHRGQNRHHRRAAAVGGAAASSGWACPSGVARAALPITPLAKYERKRSENASGGQPPTHFRHEFDMSVTIPTKNSA